MASKMRFAEVTIHLPADIHAILTAEAERFGAPDLAGHLETTIVSGVFSDLESNPTMWRRHDRTIAALRRRRLAASKRAA